MKIIQNLFGEFFQENKIEVNPSRPNSGRREKINLNFHFHTSLWDLKRFYEGLKCLHKTFWGTAKSVKIKKYVNFYFYATFWNARGGKG